MGEARKRREAGVPSLNPGTEAHIRKSRLPSARDGYASAPAGCVSESTRMWAARYADDVELLLREIDRLRAEPPPAGGTGRTR